MTNQMSLEDMERELEEILQRNHEAFVGTYANEINELLGFSRAEIDAITPGTADLEVYQALVEVVKEASRRNVAQAELKARIEQLGDAAIEIAKHVTGLAGLFL